MKITKNQLKRIIREELKATNELVVSRKPLTEAQLNEIAPVIAGIARAAAVAGRGASKLISKVVPALKQGGRKASKWVKDNPEFLESALEIVQSVADKVPDLKDVALDKKEDLLKAIEDSKISELIGDVLGQAAPELENAAEKEETNESLRRIIKEYSDYASIDDLADNTDDIVLILNDAMEKYVDSGWLEESGEKRVVDLLERLHGAANELSIELNALRGLI